LCGVCCVEAEAGSKKEYNVQFNVLSAQTTPNLKEILLQLQHSSFDFRSPCFPKLWSHWSGLWNNHWQKPPSSMLKCNLDAAIFSNNNYFGISFYTRNENGDFIRVKTSNFNGVPRPHEAEAWALYHAIQWTPQLAYQNIILESDCKTIVYNITRRIHKCIKWGIWKKNLHDYLNILFLINNKFIKNIYY